MEVGESRFPQSPQRFWTASRIALTAILVAGIVGAVVLFVFANESPTLGAPQSPLNPSQLSSHPPILPEPLPLHPPSLTAAIAELLMAELSVSDQLAQLLLIDGNHTCNLPTAGMLLPSNQLPRLQAPQLYPFVATRGAHSTVVQNSAAAVRDSGL